MSNRVAIVGSRKFSDLNAVTDFVTALPPGTTVVSGGAVGVDTTAIYAARMRGLHTEVYQADWDTLGLRAGFIRNQQIVDACDKVVAFWDGESKGTAHTIELAHKANKLVEVYYAN